MRPPSRTDVAYDLIVQRLDRMEKNHLRHIESRLNKLVTNNV